MKKIKYFFALIVLMCSGLVRSQDIHFSQVLETINATGALAYAAQQAQREVDIACTAIAHLPDSNYKQTLLELAVFSVTRNH